MNATPEFEGAGGALFLPELVFGNGFDCGDFVLTGWQWWWQLWIAWGMGP
jgi:hypothetical protein